MKLKLVKWTFSYKQTLKSMLVPLIWQTQFIIVQRYRNKYIKTEKKKKGKSTHKLKSQTHSYCLEIYLIPSSSSCGNDT